MSEAPHITHPALPAMGIVSELSEEDRAMLCSYGSFSFYQTGDKLILQGTPQDSLYLLLSGELHARRFDGSREILLGSIHQGESFGEINIFDPGTASASVIAVTASQIWKIDRLSLVDFFQVYPEASVSIASHIAAVLSRRLRTLMSQLADRVEYDFVLAEIEPGVQ